VRFRLIEHWINYSVVRDWIKLCEAKHDEHKDSGLEREFDLGFIRLIDCHTRKIVPILPEHKYVALSYVWGKAGSSQDKRGTGPGLFPTLSDQLPAVVEDAIRVVLGLKYQFYGWIDIAFNRTMNKTCIRNFQKWTSFTTVLR